MPSIYLHPTATQLLALRDRTADQEFKDSWAGEDIPLRTFKIVQHLEDRLDAIPCYRRAVGAWTEKLSTYRAGWKIPVTPYT